MVTGDILGLPIPDAGPVFAATLVVHVACGLTAVVAGALAATAKKRRGRHPRAGRIYLWALAGVFTTAIIMATIRWHEDAHLFAIAVIAFGLGLYGYRARRRRRAGWPLHHAIGTGGSYIALLAGLRLRRWAAGSAHVDGVEDLDLPRHAARRRGRDAAIQRR